MKKLVLILATFLIGTASFAQCAAGFTYAVNPANNGQVDFTSTSTSTDTATHYTYSYGDGSSSNWSANPSHTFNTGTFYVCLTINDSLGSCTSTFCDSVTVTNNTPPSCSAYFFLYDVSDSVGMANTVDIQNYSSGANLNYLWNFGDGNTGTGSGANIFHTYASPGNYTICLTITNVALTCSDTYCDSIQISSCNATFTSAPDANNYGFTFTSTSAGGPDTYLWDFGDGATSTQQNPYHQYAVNGYYTVCLTVSSTIDANCMDMQCNSVYVTGYCEANFSAWDDSLNIVYLSNNSLGGSMTYLWDFGDGNTSTSPNITMYQYSTGGTYNICLTVTNVATSCTNTECHTVYFSNCTANFSAVPDVSGNGVTFTSSAAGSPDTFQWSFGDGTSSTLPNPYHVYTTNGNYTVCLTVSSTVDSACSDYQCSSINIGGPFCSANFIIIQDSSNLFNYTIVNNASSNGTITSYLWDFGDGTTSTQAYPQHTYANSNPELICLSITTSNGCSDMYCDSIFPGMAPNQAVTVTVVPPASVGVKENNSLTESLDNYPNPFTDITVISYSISQNSPVELELYNLLGNKVATIENGNKNSGTYKTSFDASNISAGIYMLQLRTVNKVITKKLIITK